MKLWPLLVLAEARQKVGSESLSTSPNPDVISRREHFETGDKKQKKQATGDCGWSTTWRDPDDDPGLTAAEPHMRQGD